MFERALEWFATAYGGWSFLRWISISRIASEWLQKRTGVLVAPGFKFFPDREALERQRNYGEFLGTAQQINCMFISGRKLKVHEIENVSHITEVILPDPRSESFRHFCQSIDDLENLVRYVCQSTKNITENLQRPVLWYPDILHQSFMIGDPETAKGWVHFEITLPGTLANKRPSMTIYASKYEGVVQHYWQMYKHIKEHSIAPDMAFVEQTLAEK